MSTQILNSRNFTLFLPETLSERADGNTPDFVIFVNIYYN